MCGMMGYVGKRPAIEILIQGLKVLEYRGYDSAGIAFFSRANIRVVRSEGKLENVEKLLKAETESSTQSNCGIGHTRWATHGKPTTQNAHPHRTGHIVLVHNGIIENYQEIKAELLKLGHSPQSETDSELFGFLVLEQIKRGEDFATAVRQSFGKIKGQCSVVLMSEKDPGLVIGIRNGSPLVVARDPEGGTFFASDAQPLLSYTRDVIYLENGDMAVADFSGLKILDFKTGKNIERASTHLSWSIEKLGKQGYAHYMLKEIYEQPAALVDTLNGILDRTKSDPFPVAHQPGIEALEKSEEITIVACGTAWHAALVGQYWLESLARVKTTVEIASEFRYRNPVLKSGNTLIAVSQSGETADTLAAVREAKSAGLFTLGITNCRGSSLSREASSCLYTSAGPEIGVAATKTFSTQMLVLFILAGHLAHRKAKNAPENKKVSQLFEDLVRIPHLVADSLNAKPGVPQKIKEACEKLQNKKGFFFIGRGYGFALALEGALKLKEISYIHAEGYAAGELKHGPIAMIDQDMAVVVLAPQDHWRDKTVSNLEEVKARAATIVGFGNPTDQLLADLCDEWIPLNLPASFQLDESLYPFLLAPMVQLLSYEMALLKKTDVDKPRNLAKSVTVE